MNNQDMITSIIASPPQPAEHQAKLCPVCGTLNHTLSRECFNCAWRGAFPDGTAALLQAKLLHAELLQAELLHAGRRGKARIWFLTPWQQRLRATFVRAWAWSARTLTR